MEGVVGLLAANADKGRIASHPSPASPATHDTLSSTTPNSLGAPTSEDNLSPVRTSDSLATGIPGNHWLAPMCYLQQQLRRILPWGTLRVTLPGFP